MTTIAAASTLAEDHDFRSRYIRELVQGPPCHGMADQFRKITIPKLVIQYWHDPKDVPKDVRQCMDSWSALETQGFERLLFDDLQASNYISRNFDKTHFHAFNQCYHPAMRCDYFRLCFILLNGGFYVDADENYSGKKLDEYFIDGRLKVQPLCYDTITGGMIKPELFIEKKQFSNHWIFYINNNPLIAPPRHPIVGLALKRANRLILECSGKLDIQSTTGPGNITAALVEHALSNGPMNRQRNVLVIPDWEEVSTSVWPLSYRNDERNWRLFDPARSGSTFS